MNTLLLLGVEYLAIGAFSVGGGMATVPFLMSLSQRRGWFSLDELTSMVALSQSVPGPIGVNLAAYTGFTVSGLPGTIVAALALTLPSFLAILFLSKIVRSLRGNRKFEAVFYGLRAASVGLIAAVLLRFCLSTFLPPGVAFPLHWKSLLLFLLISLGLFLPRVRNLPIPVFLLTAALTGVLLQLGDL